VLFLYNVYNASIIWFGVSSSTKISKHFLLPTPANVFVLLTISQGHLVCFSIKPLTPELNPSEQRCLPGLFTGDFKFYFLVLGKKEYLIDFYFKFNEIKFCTLLTNCLIREKCSPIFKINLGL
jgi:hypothetical protein